MSTQGRKNVHGKGGVRFKAAYTKSKYESMLRTLVTDLIVHETVTVTLATAKELSSLADKLVTLGKRGDLHARRQAAEVLQNVVDAATGKTAVQKLFEEVAPKFAGQNGGYTRVLKTYNRKGDNAPMAIIGLGDLTK